MRSFIHDLSCSLRSLRRNPGFTIVAVLTLALGIAGNTVVFSIVNATLLRPLPYPEPHRLIILRWQNQGDISARAFSMAKEQARSFSSLAAFYPLDLGVNIAATGPPQYVKALTVSHDFFPTLGVMPQVGTTFNVEQDQPNAPGTVVLSHGLWTRTFNGGPSAIGQELRVNGESYRIIGIMPRGFRSYPDADIWLPLRFSPSRADLGSNYRVIGRLAPGISREQAQYELDKLAGEYHLTYLPSARKASLVGHDLQAFLVGKEREGLVLLFAAVGFVFLIACTNIAVLILVRGAASTQVLAVRAALGRSRRRLVLSLLTESLVLSLIGGLLGLILAKEALPLLLRWLWPADLPMSASLRIDEHVALFTLLISLLSPLLFGLAPALKLTRLDIVRVLAHTSHTFSASVEQLRAVRLLVFCQIALTVMLLAGTVLLGRSLLNLYSAALGFDTGHLFVAQVSLAGEKYRATTSTSRMVNEVVKRLQLLPNVDGVAVVNGLPLEKGLNLPIRPAETHRGVDHADEYRPVTSDYFRTLRIPLRSGRFFTPQDRAGGAPVAIINETMARRWWPGEPALGHLLKVDEELGPEFADVPREIVGVVADIQEKGPQFPPPPTIFVPLDQTPDRIAAFLNKVFLTSIIISASRRVDLSMEIRRAIQLVDPDLPLASFRSFGQVIDRSLEKARFLALLTSVFGAFALLLTIIGIQGLLNYQASLRGREIAVRMSVGASRTHIVLMVVQQGAKLICFAVLVGLAGAFIVRSLLRSFVYNVQSTSTIIVVATGLFLGVIATLISLLTAAGAASIEPMAVLRNE